jgi:hypothetical protein
MVFVDTGNDPEAVKWQNHWSCGSTVATLMFNDHLLFV